MSHSRLHSDYNLTRQRVRGRTPLFLLIFNYFFCLGSVGCLLTELQQYFAANAKLKINLTAHDKTYKV